VDNPVFIHLAAVVILGTFLAWWNDGPKWRQRVDL